MVGSSIKGMLVGLLGRVVRAKSRNPRCGVL